MKKTKFILFLLTILLSVLMIISSAGCKGKKSEAMREKAPRVLEEETYDPCGEAVEEEAEDFE